MLQEAWRRVAKNRGAPGVDGQSIQWIRQHGVTEFLAEIAVMLKAERYHPKHVKRVYIDKPDGSQRPLGIPAVIRYWLKAGVFENGVVMYPELGSPQGGVLSPLLANIYLHRVDQEWQQRRPREVLIRYADDMLILCPTQAAAEQAYTHLQGVLSALSLTLNQTKTRLTAARDGFDFLGFSFRRGVYTRHGCRREIIIKVPRAKAEKAMRACLCPIATVSASAVSPQTQPVQPPLA